MLILYACINLHFVPLCVLFFKDSYIQPSINGSEDKCYNLKRENILSVNAGDGDKELYGTTKIQKEKDVEIGVEENATTEKKMLLKKQPKELEMNVDLKNDDTDKQDILLTSSQRESQCDNDKASNSFQLYIKKLSIVLKDPMTLCYYMCEATSYF